MLERLEVGSLSIVEDGRTTVLGHGAPCAEIVIVDPRFWIDVATRGSVGLGEAYLAGRWSSPQIVDLLRLFLQNASVLRRIEGGLAKLRRSRDALLNAARRNTPDRSRENVAAHYDLGNDFFELVLDPTLSYSCAVFEPPGITLERASQVKIEKSCDKLALAPGQSVLEIGSGWGAFALALAARGCQVTTTTISHAQYELARARVAAAGLSDRIELCERDWRSLSGRYQRLVCIEMIEAVGHAYYGDFFRRCHELLAPGGRMLLQAIVVDDDHFEWAKDRVDFVKKHIFPGTCLPSLAVLERALGGAGLELAGVEDLTAHYPATLRAWRDNLLRNADAIRARGYPNALIRSWEYYLAYCEAGFAERHIRDFQLVLERRR